MKYCMLAQTGHNIPMKDTIKLIKHVGFTEVYLSGNESVISNNDIQNIYDNSLSIEAYHLPYNMPFNLINSLWLNDVNAMDAKKIIKAHFDFICGNKIRKAVLHASSGFNPPPITQQGLDNFKSIIDYGSNMGLLIAIENIKRMDYVESLLDNNRNENVGFCFDIGHANAFTRNLYDYDWAPLLQRLISIHLHDNDGKEDLHLIPGLGNIKFDYVFNTLLKGRDVNICLETYYKGRERYYYGINSKQFFDKVFHSIDQYGN